MGYYEHSLVWNSQKIFLDFRATLYLRETGQSTELYEFTYNEQLIKHIHTNMHIK